MMFWIACQLLQRLFVLVARSIFVRILVSIEMLLALISWYPRVNSLLLTPKIDLTAIAKLLRFQVSSDV
ncbi:hypothetical protein ON021_22030 [Microcoleus sp. HI-ES]|nr:hypothetical protein [Microcoleus sp. HI-ES]